MLSSTLLLTRLIKHIIMIFGCIILFILTLASSSDCGNSMETFSSNVTDQQALISIKAYITGDPLGVLSSWNHSVHFCQWEGVTCSRRRQRVTALDLSTQQLDGTLSPHIGNLSFLRAIYLDKNNIRGSIPGEIGQLSRLRYLHLGNNSFQGMFPMNLSYCSDIRNISVRENNLKGKLPTEFTSWPKLVVFNARINHFTGSIPSSIGNMSYLRILDIARNNLTGSIPLEVAQLLNLEYLQLSINKLSGTIPLQLYNISSLSFVSLTQNELEGRIPTDFAITLPNLQIFLANENKLSGPFPPSITNASKLVYFEIAFNNITGPLPINLGSLLNIQWLSLGGNQLGRNQSPGGLSFLGGLVNSTLLKYLSLDQNGLSGELPNSIVNLSTTLDYLGFSRNYIYGSIPREIGKLTKLTGLALTLNRLRGSIPESVCKLSNLELLSLGDNNISGVIPTCISNITRLSLLTLESNKLYGSIPTALFNISSLQGLDISKNHLSGVIPERIIGLSSQCLALYLSQNLLTGPLPSNIGSLIHLVDLRLSDNKLTGEIPNSLGNCVMLEELHMDRNLLEGRIPSFFNDLKSLVFLDLSDNNMSGNIPNSLGEFPLMLYLNLSHNKLQGQVPTKGVFLNVSAFSVVGNLELCGGIDALQLPTCHSNIKRTKKKHFAVRIIPFVVLPLGILSACFALIFYQIKKSNRKKITSSVLQDEQYPRLTYQDLLLATNEFSLDNLLGEGRYGSVYRGVHESLQQTVAVKVLNVEVHGANKSFLAECETLRNIRHRNLIRIITTCSSTDFKGNDFKALVFEFMKNGSLEKWLHPLPSNKGNEISLTLHQRLNIAIDIALAIDYLHHASQTSIIHCDIKPSNILLDDEFVARVGDFGLSRFSFTTTSESSDINQAQTMSTGVRGTVGYVPPEYGMGGKISTEGDVYSYGILLLEMFSGQRPTASNILMNHANNLHDYVRKALPHRVTDVADPLIVLHPEVSCLTVNQSYNRAAMETCLTLIFEVGISCSVEMPRDRINISVALKQLYVAREKLLRQEHQPE